MRLDLAKDVQVNNLLYNCFREPLVVKEKNIFYTNDPNHRHIQSIKFRVLDSQSHTHLYDSEDLYLAEPNMDDEDDIEKAWINWATENKDFIETFDHVVTVKEIYKTGFAHGFEHKRKVLFEEMMQK